MSQGLSVVDFVSEEVSAVLDGHYAFPETAAGEVGMKAGAGTDVLFLPWCRQRAAFQVQPHWIVSSTALPLQTEVNRNRKDLTQGGASTVNRPDPPPLPTTSNGQSMS